MENTKSYRRWFRLAFGVIVLLFSGIIYAWTTIRTPFREFGWSDTRLLLNYTITMCMFCISGFASGMLSKKLSEAVRLIAAAVLAAGGLILVSTIDGSSIIPLYIGYGFMTGAGIGIVYNVVVSATNSWFPDRKGVSSGALMMGFGLGSFFIGMIADKMFTLESIGWRKTYLIFGILLGVILLAAAVFVRSAGRGNAPAKASSEKTDKTPAEFTAREVLKRPSFWKLFVFFMLFAAVGSTAIADARSMMTDLGVVSGISAIALLVPVFNSLGRISCGVFFDAFGLRKTQYLTSGVVIVATGISLIGFITGITAFGIVGLLCCGFSYGFSPTVSAAFTAEFYGMKNFSLNFSMLNLILIPASFAPTLSGMLVSSSSSYIPTFALLTGLSVVGLILNLTIKRA